MASFLLELSTGFLGHSVFLPWYFQRVRWPFRPGSSLPHGSLPWILCALAAKELGPNLTSPTVPPDLGLVTKSPNIPYCLNSTKVWVEMGSSLWWLFPLFFLNVLFWNNFKIAKESLRVTKSSYEPFTQLPLMLTSYITVVQHIYQN